MICRYFNIIIISLLIFGCNQKNAWDCVQTTGKEVEVEYEFDDVLAVSIDGDIDVQVIPNQSEFSLKFIGGENLIDDINLIKEGSSLTINNTNKCGLLRDQSKSLLLQINCDSLNKLKANIIGDLVFTDTLRSSSFNYIIDNAVGQHEILYSGNSVELTLHAGTNHVFLQGRAYRGSIYSNAGNTVFAEAAIIQNELQINKVNNSPVHANCPGEVILITTNAGPVYLYSVPDTIYRWGDKSADVYFR
jgi:hypothetical protein